MCVRVCVCVCYSQPLCCPPAHSVVNLMCILQTQTHTHTNTHSTVNTHAVRQRLEYQIPNKYLEPDSQRRQQGAFHALRLSLCCHCSSSRRRQGDNAQSFHKLVKDVDKAGNELRLAIPKKIKKGNRDKKNASKPRQRVQQELEEEEDFFDRHSISRCRKCRKFAEELTR